VPGDGSAHIAISARPRHLTSQWSLASPERAITAFLLEMLASSKGRAQLNSVIASFLTGFNQNERDNHVS